jgi:hypothetical protein
MVSTHLFRADARRCWLVRLTHVQASTAPVQSAVAVKQQVPRKPLILPPRYIYYLLIAKATIAGAAGECGDTALARKYVPHVSQLTC